MGTWPGGGKEKMPLCYNMKGDGNGISTFLSLEKEKLLGIGMVGGMVWHVRES